MNRILLIALFIFSLAAHASEAPPTGFSIIKKQHDQARGYRDFSAQGEMLLKNKAGKLDTKRSFQITETEEAPGQPARLLLKIKFPPELTGTGLLSISSGQKQTSQQLYLPALKQTKTIVANSRGGRFLGSEFYYEDLIPYSWQSYNYQLITQSNWNQIPCYIIELTPNSSTQSQYGKILYTIEKERLLTLKTDFYSTKGELIKEATFENYQLLQNKFWRPLKITMKSLKSGRSTELLLSEVQISSGIKPESINQGALER